jgi:hypothetical protein
MTCGKCGGAGWVWWEELDEYEGPANNPYDCYSDDTKYTCDACNGTGVEDDD